VGGLVGYLVAEGALRLHRHERAAGEHHHPMPIGAHWGANLRA
jgi:hypothetical protein